jgi:HAD superfamily hydrolase (TIGR01509 family)
MLKDIKAAIFDLDGTLIDSMWIWIKIDCDFLQKRGIEVPSDLREAIEHLSAIDTAKYFKERFNLPESIEEILAEWDEMAYYEYANNIKLKPGAREFLERLKKRGIRIALATSNSKLLLEASLKNNGIYEYFEEITTTNEVSRGKSFPDVYLLSAQKLGVNPSECIVFEDILPAVLGAKAAGMIVVGVHDIHAEHQTENIKENAHHFIYKYDDFNAAV